MALQVLNDPGLGNLFGQQLSTGLQNLANYKMNQLQQSNMARGVQGLLQQNITPEQQSQLLSLLSPEMQQEYLKQELRRPSEEAYARALFGGGESGDMGGELDNGLDGAPARLNERQFTEVAKQREKRAERKEKREVESFKQTKPERNEILTDARSAQNALDDLQRLEELEGALDSNAYNELLTNSGLDIPALRSPESQEFLKIRQSFLRDAKKYFGARVTNFELDQFLKTIPDLSQSPEGRKRVIANLKRFNRLAVDRANVMREVIDDNGGIPPLDLVEKVDKRMEKKSQVIADKFKKDLEKKVPKGSSKLATTAGALGGKLLGEVGEAVPGLIRGGIGGGLAGLAYGGPAGILPGAAYGAAGGGIGRLLGFFK